MELEDDVDVSEFGPEILRRQQVQSYLIKVLVTGLDDATKIQYYHRLAAIFEKAHEEMVQLLHQNRNLDSSDTEYQHLGSIYEDFEELHVELSNLLLLNNDDDMLIAVCRFISAVGQDIRIVANTEDSEAEMTEKMLQLIQKSQPGSLLYVYATGVLSLLLRPQEYEVDAVRHVATTKFPELFLKQLHSMVQTERGRELTKRCEPGYIDNSAIVFAPASVNEEVDNEEPKLSEIVVKASQLNWNEFTWSLEVVIQVSQYVEVLAPVLQNGGVELIHFLLTSQSFTLVSYGLSCLTSLVTHPKFAHLFLARDGLLLLLARPCSKPLSKEYNKVMCVVINNLLQYPATIEQICLLNEGVLAQLLELMFWLFENAQEESLKTLFIALSRLVIYETFVEVFQRQQYVDTIIKFWKFCQAVADGKAITRNSLEHMNLVRVNPIRVTDPRNGTDFTFHLVPRTDGAGGTMEISAEPAAPPAPVHEPIEISSDDSDDDDEESSRKVEMIDKDFEKFKHLRFMSPSSARTLIDHVMLLLSEYFSASCVQTWSASARHLIGIASLAAPTNHTLTPRYRATNTTYEHIASCNIAHYGIATLPDTAVFIQEGGLELLLLSLYSNVPFVPNSQTSTDIITAGLKLLWIMSMIQTSAESIIHLKIEIPEPVGLNDTFARQFAARFTEMLARPNGNGPVDIPIIGGFGGMGAMAPRIEDAGDEEDAPHVEAENQAPAPVNPIDTSNIRLEPVNQRLALERSIARQSASAADPAPSNGVNTTASASIEGEVAAEPNQAEVGNQMEVDAPTPAAPTSNTRKPRTRTTVWLLLYLLRKLAHPVPPVGLYVLQIYLNYLHPVSCRPCNSRAGSPEWAVQASSEIRMYNGLSELVDLLKFHEINLVTHSTQQLNSVVIKDWNIIRTHAIHVLKRMANQDMAVHQILSKKLSSSLPEILRVPSPPGFEKSFSKFKEEAMEFLASSTTGSNFKKEDSRFEGSHTLSELERASIISNTPIRYSNQELLGLIYQHLQSNGLHKAAEALAADAKLPADLVRPVPPPTAPKRLRRPSMPGSASATLTTASMATPGPAHPDAPLNEHGFLSSAATSHISLDTIVKQFLFEQHRHCHHPVQVLPDLSLQAQHSCPNPIRHRMNPYGAQSMNMAHRLMHHSIVHAPMRSPAWRQYKYSRFAPRRKFSDGGLLTSITFVGNDSIYFGSGDGLVVKYNSHTVNYDGEWEVRDGPVDIKVSQASSRVMTMCEARSGIIGAPEDIKIWDLANMSHELGTLPFVTAQFSNSGYEVLGTNTHGMVSLWDVNSNTVVRQFNESTPMDEDARHVKMLQPGHFSNDDCLVLYNSSLWDKRKSTPIHNFDRFTMSTGVQIFAPSGLEVITNTEVWDSRTFKLLKTVPALHRATLAYSSAGDILYCGSKSKVEILDGATYDYISQIGLESSFSSLSVNPDDTQVAILENLSPDRWPAESAWRLWDIGTSRTLDDEDGSESEDDEADEMAGFDSDHDIMDEDGEDDDDEDGNGGGGRNLGIFHGEPIMIGSDVDEDDEDDDDDDEMMLGDDDEEGEEWETDTDYSGGFGDYAHVHGDDDEDDEDLQFDSEGELVEIDDFDPEGDGLSSEHGSEVNISELDLNSDEEAILFGNRRGASEGRRNRRGSGNRSSVFVELPSDEEAANELIEHGNMGDSASDDDNSEPSVMEFDDDGEAMDPTLTSSNARQGRGDVHEMGDTSSDHMSTSEMEISEEAPVRPPPPTRRARSNLSASSTTSNTSGGRRRGLPSLRELGRMLGLAGKRTAAAPPENQPTVEEASSDEDREPVESPPAKKKPRRK